MRSLKPLLKIEIKNNNFILNLIITVMLYVIFISMLVSAKDKTLTILMIFPTIIFTIIGILWSLEFIESLKNVEDSNLIKTYISYPIKPLQYILSKLIFFYSIDIIGAFIGSILSLIIIGETGAVYIEFFLIGSLFSILASISFSLLASLLSRFSIMSEVIIIIPYFSIFSILFSSLSYQPVFYLFPYYRFFSKTLEISNSNISFTNLIIAPVLYSVIIILSLITIKFSKWIVFYNFDK